MNKDLIIKLIIYNSWFIGVIIQCICIWIITHLYYFLKK